MKTPISYYGGKQNLAKLILSLFPRHKLYAEPFVGGGAIFWTKNSSEVEVINDTNKELINFYEVCQNDFVSLEKLVRISLHSRSLHRDATVVNDNPHMFTREKRAWAIWVLASQSFASMLDGSWGYDKAKGATSRKISNKRDDFTEKYAIRLQNVQIECTDALRIINSRDNPDAFFYCDPPYFNSDCGHYNGYGIDDFESLLKALQVLEGKFLLSSYPSDILGKYAEGNGWYQKEVIQTVSVSHNSDKPQKKKVEVLTANYDLSNPTDVKTLFN
ncbi:methyltransferase [Labilibaculum manganireducens]|uniref:Methyltransferase n=1 Tax=Labilibaculum manganireducens TaxID=1940525 RepID=A0A2N3IGN0_9BACT|nr:DNA adenine methylase [Labilibaculum manganireducens]PKQ69403.1 methyltransferase [Labilibaculum manganireducens]